ncbi:DNA-J related domain-containing protein [Bowmanella denitrificans]|uniref:DNA-J related domain-containing protein n=1 Tax=Bowmanella denitrificans TaxID=366582 RepID=A0ABP3GQA6_9ALTE
MNPSPDLTDLLHNLLQQAPQGISEYALIDRLKEPAMGVFTADLDLSDNLVLFQTHFLLFNQLYQLREQLRARREGDLQISALRIQLLPYSSGSAELTEHDALCSYYLDWQNLQETDSGGVTQLLEGFWQRMAGQLSADERREALAVLELDEQADSETIRRQYRRLMHQHHPDKGGQHQYCQLLTQAYRKLT